MDERIDNLRHKLQNSSDSQITISRAELCDAVNAYEFLRQKRNPASNTEQENMMEDRYEVFNELHECLKYIYENGEFYHSAIESLGASFGSHFERRVSDALIRSARYLIHMKRTDKVSALIHAWDSHDAWVELVSLDTPTWVEIGERPMSGKGELHRIDQALVTYGEARLAVRQNILPNLTSESLFEFFDQLKDDITLAVHKLVEDELRRDDVEISLEVKTSDRMQFRALLRDGNYEKP